MRITNFPLKTKGKGKNLTCVLIPGTSQNIAPMLFPLPQVTTAIIEYAECWQALSVFKFELIELCVVPRNAFPS